MSYLPRAREFKSMTCWGSQNGLLSVAELAALMDALRTSGARHVLEVGHYYGLSTAALASVLREGEGPWTLNTVDSHEPCPEVMEAAPREAFEANRLRVFPDPEVLPVFMRSQEWTHWGDPFIFYDGDHGEEQLWVMQNIYDAGLCQTIAMDDADFPWPAVSVQYLIARGWTLKTPPPVRYDGDKENPSTMTLAVLTRGATKC